MMSASSSSSSSWLAATTTTVLLLSATHPSSCAIPCSLTGGGVRWRTAPRAQCPAFVPLSSLSLSLWQQQEQQQQQQQQQPNEQHQSSSLSISSRSWALPTRVSATGCRRRRRHCSRRRSLQLYGMLPRQGGMEGHDDEAKKDRDDDDDDDEEKKAKEDSLRHRLEFLMDNDDAAEILRQKRREQEEDEEFYQDDEEEEEENEYEDCEYEFDDDDEEEEDEEDQDATDSEPRLPDVDLKSKRPSHVSKKSSSSSSSSSPLAPITADDVLQTSQLGAAPPPLYLTAMNRRRRELEISLLESLAHSDQAVAGLWSLWFQERGPEAAMELQEAESLARRGPPGWKEAEAQFRAIVQREGMYNWVEPVNRLATLLYEQGRWLESKALCQVVLAQKPWHFGALSGMVMLCANLGNAKGVEFYAQQLLPSLQDEDDEQDENNDWMPPLAATSTSSLPPRMARQGWVHRAVRQAKLSLAKEERRMNQEYSKFHNSSKEQQQQATAQSSSSSSSTSKSGIFKDDADAWE